MAGAAFRAAFVAMLGAASLRYGYSRVPVRYFYAQAWLETGGFSSAVFLGNCNAFGLKEPRIRPTTAVGTARGHAVFLSLADCVEDYFLRQRYFRIPNDRARYIAATVASGYAEAPGYADAWRALIVQGAGWPTAAPLVVPLGVVALSSLHDA